ncbi:hypothetical protein MTR_1g009000 [Medicago truncatula]|uniref:Uncharacterized protein n=1 Tax=Medicago truncatula TaxID=3880 RepID=G7I548_MEDTR|nr:hypothetical protein MTR_1g009000 [Medicago truncatula]
MRRGTNSKLSQSHRAKTFTFGKALKAFSPSWMWLMRQWNGIIQSGWLEILECAPLKVLGSNLSSANFGGQVHTELCSDLEQGPCKWAVELVPRIS